MKNKFKYYVYALIDPRNNKPFYIGKGCGNRWRTHLYSKEGGEENRLKLRKINSIRRASHEPFVKILLKNLREEIAFNAEKKYIKKYGKIKDKTGILTNILDGGDQPPFPGYGEDNHFYGKTHTEEAKEKIRIARAKQVSPMKGRKTSEEAKEKQSKARKGRFFINKRTVGISVFDLKYNFISEHTNIKCCSKFHNIPEFEIHIRFRKFRHYSYDGKIFIETSKIKDVSHKEVIKFHMWNYINKKMSKKKRYRFTVLSLDELSKYRNISELINFNKIHAKFIPHL